MTTPRTYAIIDDITGIIVDRGLTMRAALALHDDLCDERYCLVSDERADETVAAIEATIAAASIERALASAAQLDDAERERVHAACLELHKATGHIAYQRAADDIDAGAQWRQVAVGRWEVKRPLGDKHIVAPGACNCLGGRHFCRHQALIHGAIYDGRMQDAEAAPLAA